VRELGGRVYPDNETEKHSGVWRSKFPDSSQAQPKRALHVELGCNAGHVVVEWASRNPADAYVGIDWKFKAIFRGAEKAVKRKSDNLLFFRVHNERLPYIFAPGEIDRLYLYFPDPWPKKRDWKYRFVNERNLRAIAPLLALDGVFHIKTDHPGYYEWMRQAVDQCKDAWKILEETRDLHAGHPAPKTLKIPDVTLFERLFIQDGIKIHSLKLGPVGH
jgi:tRNA (guanine-N7-)-methyltransferase